MYRLLNKTHYIVKINFINTIYNMPYGPSDNN